MTLPARLFAVALVALSLAACAPAEGNAARGRGPLTAEAIREANVSTNAFDLLQSTRPEWLRARGTQTFQGGDSDAIRVYVNGSSYGPTPESLRQLPVDNIQQVQFLSPAQATTRFGAGHLSGVILVETR